MYIVYSRHLICTVESMITCDYVDCYVCAMYVRTLYTRCTFICCTCTCTSSAASNTKCAMLLDRTRESSDSAQPCNVAHEQVCSTCSQGSGQKNTEAPSSHQQRDQHLQIDQISHPPCVSQSWLLNGDVLWLLRNIPTAQ